MLFIAGTCVNTVSASNLPLRRKMAATQLGQQQELIFPNISQVFTDTYMHVPKQWLELGGVTSWLNAAA